MISYNYGAYGLGSGSFFSYSAGGGLEFIVANKFGISLELGYGKLNVSDGVAVAGIVGGGGLHYYLK
ncbi:hypothetical protein GALL_64630 [mine drainage metagenome]|uniref:Outer membrane protein beta-barrel domain-containing protein n=1 Tax=mine drainage metagenome TaxID=410659 RepID=A0A1J5SUI5_9ZZZZ